MIKKRAVIDEGLEPQIISMYAKGMSVRDISEHLQALYRIELSATSIDRQYAACTGFMHGFGA